MRVPPRVALLPALLLFAGCSGILDAGARFAEDAGGGLDLIGREARPFAGLAADDVGASAERSAHPPADAAADTTCALSGAAYEDSLTADFAARDKLPQSAVPEEDWDTFPSGPPAATYPAVEPPQCVDALGWRRDRVIAVAKRYLGLPYAHHRFPALGGLDCSTFTSWVYNYGLGTKFDSGAQTQGDTVGRKLSAKEPLARGDLLFFWNSSSGPGKAGHAALFIEGDEFIHSNPTPDDGVQLEQLSGWWQDHFLWARRVLE